MSQLSIIIPALTGIELMEEGLVSVLQHRPANAEVVVVLNRPYNDPYDLGDEVRWVPAGRRTRLAHALDLGMTASRGEFVHFLAAGSQVSPDWCEAALASFVDHDVAAVAPLVVPNQDDQDAATFGILGVEYVPGGGRRTARGPLNPTGEENIFGPVLDAAFYRREAIAAVGGVATSLGDDLLDVDLALGMRRAGYRAVACPDARVSLPAGATPRVGATRRGLYAERLFRRNQALAQRAGSHLAAVLRQPSQWGGRLLALLDGRPRRQQQRLARLAQQRAASSAPATVPFTTPAEPELAPLRKSA